MKYWPCWRYSPWSTVRSRGASSAAGSAGPSSSPPSASRSGLGWLSLSADAETIRTLAELTLALVLFTDAAGADLGVLRRASRLPIRLLLVELPLTILLGYGVGVLVFDQLSVLSVSGGPKV